MQAFILVVWGTNKDRSNAFSLVYICVYDTQTAIDRAWQSLLFNKEKTK